MGNEVMPSAPADLETEADAYALLERLRWGDDGPTECPHCGSEKGAWFLKPKDPEG
ncbi:transposase [Acidimicrobiales bacterium]|nr:transposase [Acidimicrobiales bacterium]